MFLKPDTRWSNEFFSDYLEIWLDAFIDDRNARGYAKVTIGFYLDKLKLFMRYADGIALKKVEDISPRVIREYLLWLDGRGHTIGGIHAAYRGLRTFLLWYADENDLPNSPISKVPAPRVPVQPREGVSLEVVRKLAPKATFEIRLIFTPCSIPDAGQVNFCL